MTLVFRSVQILALLEVVRFPGVKLATQHYSHLPDAACEAHFCELHGSLCHPPQRRGKATAGLTARSIKVGTGPSNTWILVLHTYKVENEGLFSSVL